MGGRIEHIRMEVGAGPPEVLQQTGWSGDPPSQNEFLEVARPALAAYFKLDNDNLLPRAEFGVLRGRPPVAEAIRFISDDGTELYRYDLHWLESEKAFVVKFRVGDKVRPRPEFHIRPDLRDMMGIVSWVEQHPTQTGPTYRVDVQFENDLLRGVYAHEFRHVE